MTNKIYYTMGEVSEMFDLSAPTFRFWEQQFPTLRPKRNKKGNRLYTADDIETLKKIYYLVKERGLKIEAAKKQLRAGSNPDFERNMELVERLRHIRTLLQQIKEELKEEQEEIAVGDELLVVNEETEIDDTTFEQAVEVIVERGEKDNKVAEIPPKPIATEQLLF